MKTPLVFEKILDLHVNLCLPNLKELGGFWEEDIDENWHISMNGTKEEMELGKENSMKCHIPPFSVAVFWNGWLAGIVDPRGGVLAAHPNGANENTLIEAIEKRIYVSKTLAREK